MDQEELINLADPKKGNIFVRVFNGDVSLPITYWVWGSLGSALFGAAYLAIELNYASIAIHPYGYVLLNTFYWVTIAYLVFIWVAIWRSAGKYQGSGWGTVARAMVVIGMLSAAGQFITGLDQGLDDEASIAEEVRLFNLSLPTMVDEDTRMDSVSYDTDQILFSHTLINSTIDEYDVELFNELQRSALTESLCVEQDSKEGLESGITYAYAYVDMNGTLIAEIDIDLADCD